MNTGGMTIGTMLGQSAILTVMGMATVFLFISIMIFVLGLVHKAVHALKLDTDVAVSAAAPAVAQTVPAAGGDGAVVAAIAAAIHAKQGEK
jgi:sodium pump decarboxylase gamma subunit